MMLLRQVCTLAPVFFLSLADLMGIPSGLHMAWMTAQAARGGALIGSMAASAAAMLLRLLWGVHPHAEQLLSLGALWLLRSQLMKASGNLHLALMTGLLLLPTALAAIPGGAPADVMTGCLSLVLGALSEPVFHRAMETLEKGRRMDLLEDRLAIGYLTLMILSGGGRMMLAGMNVGVLCASVLTLLCGMHLGMGAGVIMGMGAGLVLSMQGLPLMLSIALALGGMLAGVTQVLGRRYMTCAGFAAGSLLVMLMAGASGAGCAISAGVSAVGIALLPRQWTERVQLFFRRFDQAQSVSGDAYAASALAAWEKTVASLAQAVPQPVQADEERNGEWWQCRLCSDCPELEGCGCMCSPAAANQAELVWSARNASEPVWLDALENLRGLGCARLYHLRKGMERLRLENMEETRQIARLTTQRDMLVTHLTAMAGSARRFAMLSAGDSWWDDMSAKRLRKALSELAYPASVMYVRRIQGHARVAFALHAESDGKQAQELCELASRVLDAPMSILTHDAGRVEVTELPLYRVEAGLAARGYKDQSSNGDTAFAGLMQDGRYLAALSDGMGHGERARQESAQTVELLRLCLDAGYTRQQAVTAVNGMMLMAGRGERFSTVDLLTIDLWTGQATLDKLGAAGSWLVQADGLTCLTGDALPLGILEHVASRSCVVRLHAGDEVILLTDGVEDAFTGKAALEEAIRLAIMEPTAQRAADMLLERSAASVKDGREDDQSVIVLRMVQTKMT